MKKLGPHLPSTRPTRDIKGWHVLHGVADVASPGPVDHVSCCVIARPAELARKCSEVNGPALEEPA